jgi:hypothetical protein
MDAPHSGQMPRLRADIADFWRFVRSPDLGRLAPRRLGGAQAADWVPRLRARRLLAWVAMLWVINLFAVGPIALAAAGLGGAQHRLDLGHIPWVTAIFWAPVVEEMLFRYGLRRPAQALWVVPALVLPLMYGPGRWTLALLVAVVLLARWSFRRGLARRHWGWQWRRRYCRAYPAVFHLAVLVFAGMHLGNFYLNHTQIWLMPVLVLPQWVTGLVLGWMRTRRGIGASIAVHSMFNAGPVLLVLGLMKWLPQAMS